MNGVMSNGFSPVARSNVGSMVSPNCTKQLGHHDSTSPVFDCAQLVDGVAGEADERVDVAGAKLAGCRSSGSVRP